MNNTTIPARSVQSSGQDIITTNKLSPLITYLNSFFPNPFAYTYKPDIPNGQKHVLYIDPYIYPSKVSTYSFYDRKFVFQLPQNYGYLAQVILECTLTSTGDNTNVKDRLGARLFSSINLETIRGPSTIQTITSDYTNSVLDELDNDQQQIERSTYPNTTFSAGSTVTIYVPLFFNFSLSEKTYLVDTEPLQITAHTHAILGAMGLVNDITDFNIRAVCTYFKMARPNISVARTILSTDCYTEPSYSLSSGATSATLQITCPFPVINMHVVVRNTSQNYIRASVISLKSGNYRIVDLDRTINYSLLADSKSRPTGTTENNGSGVFTYWFGLRPDRTGAQLPVNFKDLQSKTLTVTLANATPDSTYSIYVFFEYLVQLNIDDEGDIHRQLIY